MSQLCSLLFFRLHGFSILYFKILFPLHSFIEVIFFFPPIAWLVHFFCIQKLFQPQASQRSKASPKAWVIFRCFCTVSFTASRAWISGGIVPMNPCNETFKESHLGIVNISFQHVSLQHCCVAAFTPILVTSSTLSSLFNSGSIDIQQSLNTSSPWSKLKTGVSPLG